MNYECKKIKLPGTCWYWQCLSQLQNTSVNVQKGGDKPEIQTLHDKDFQLFQEGEKNGLFWIFWHWRAAVIILLFLFWNEASTKKSMAVSIERWKWRRENSMVSTSSGGVSVPLLVCRRRGWIKSLNLNEIFKAQTAARKRERRIKWDGE